MGESTFRKILLIALIGITLPQVFVFATNDMYAGYQRPATMEYLKTFFGKVGVDLPGQYQKSWAKAVEIWQELWNRVKVTVYHAYTAIYKFIVNVFQSFQAEVLRREPYIKDEFTKEKTEMGQDITNELPAVRKGLWDRFIDLIR